MGSRSRSNILQPRTDAAAAREARSATAPRGRSGKAPWLLLVHFATLAQDEQRAAFPSDAEVEQRDGSPAPAVAMPARANIWSTRPCGVPQIVRCAGVNRLLPCRRAGVESA